MAHLASCSIGCGIRQIFSLIGILDNKAEELFQLIYDTDTEEGFQFLFSDQAKPTSPGSKLARFIRAKGYGRLTSGPCSINPGSGNKVRVWIWLPNFKFWRVINRMARR